MTLYIKNYYLNTPLDRWEYIWFPLDLILEETILLCPLRPIIHKCFIYMEIRKGMYGFPQAGILAYKKLKNYLGQHGFKPTKYTPGLWTHNTILITFSLVVDDFGIKYTHKKDILNFINILQQEYTITKDWSGTKYIGLTLEWNYKRGYVDLSMPGYIERALKRFAHPPITKNCDSPRKFTR